MHCINVKQVKQIVACIVDTLHSISCSPVSVEVSVQIISQMCESADVPSS